MIQIKSTPGRDINAICKEHFDALKGPLETAIRRNIKGEKRKKYLLNNLEKIITASPDKLLLILTNYKRFCKRNKTLKWSTNLPEAFSYENFRSREKYNLYHLAIKLQVNVCPYCNRQYTFTVINAKKGITRPEFDHFFSQEKFPLFSLSFYNLVPSCHTCNATLKHTKAFSLIGNIHPYLNGFSSDCIFKYKPLDSKASAGLNENYELKLKLNNKSILLNNINGNTTVFKLKEIYENHPDIIKEIVRKEHISGGNYLFRLKKMFHPYLNDINELYKIAFGNFYNEEDYEKRPLAKFSKDIFNDSLFLMPK